MLDPSDTIAAVASPPGPGFRGLVRLTGPDAWAIALTGFSADRDPPDPSARHAECRAGWLTVDGLRPCLPATLALWPGPRTYTGQPMTEIHMVGATPLVQLVLAHCLARGARLAEPGEFTLRAFLSGRIDLTRAEAVLGVIDARTPAQLDAALRQLAGGLAGPIVALRDRLLDALAHLEANLDFVDEADVDPLGHSELAGELAGAAVEVAALADRLRSRDRPEGLPRVVLVGPPNAGKSRLFNALLGRDHALVSPRAGTTRDYLSAPCDCDGLTIELIDTAGLDDARSGIESRAQSFSADQADRADLVLDCRSPDTPPAPPIAADRPRLLIWTKSDVAPPPDPSALLATSARTGAGLAPLRSAIAKALRGDAADGDPIASTGARCRESLCHASESLQSASETLRLGGGDELVAIDLRQAVDELGKVVGAVVTDDILDRIFRRFCIGK
ncbi:MAG: tRNA modification GTPase [Planctomycetaceae bacterium]|nr:tRNA modification GTPase [Planctomycetaceae bacterium]